MIKEAMAVGGFPMPHIPGGMAGATMLRGPQPAQKSQRNDRLPDGKVFFLKIFHPGDPGANDSYYHEGAIIMNQLGWGMSEAWSSKEHRLVEKIFVGNWVASMSIVDEPSWWKERVRA